MALPALRGGGRLSGRQGPWPHPVSHVGDVVPALASVCMVAQALVDRSKLDTLIWNALGTEFRSRQEWYESSTNGNQEQMRADRLGPATPG